MLTIRFIAFIFCGIIFTMKGYFLRREKKFLGFSFIILGLFIIYIITIGPLSKSRDIIISITKIDYKEVRDIKILPSNEKEKQIIKSEILIKDEILLKEICDGLNKASEEGEGFLKIPDWKCIVIIDFKSNETIKFEVRGKEGVTGLILNSNGESGWHYGNLRADNFGKTIREATKKQVIF